MRDLRDIAGLFLNVCQIRLLVLCRRTIAEKGLPYDDSRSAREEINGVPSLAELDVKEVSAEEFNKLFE